MPHLLTDINFDALEFLSVVDEGEGGNPENRPAIMLIKRKGDQPSGDVIDLRIPVAKLDTAQRTVFGLASIITDKEGRPIVDAGDDVIMAEDLEKAVHRASLIGGAGKAGDMHLFKGVADLVESAVITHEKRKAAGGFLGDSLAEGWWVGLKVRDEAVWQDILKGRRPELSIKISAKRTKIDDASMFAKFKKWLQSRKTQTKGLGEYPTSNPEGSPPMPTLDEILATLPEDTRNALLAHIQPLMQPKADFGNAPNPELKQGPVMAPTAPSAEETAKALAKLPDSVREQVEKSMKKAEDLEEKNKDLEKRVDKMEDEAELEKCIKIAADEFPYLNGSARELGVMFKSARKSMSDEDFKRWHTTMKAANAAVETSGMWNEFGSAGPGSDHPEYAELESKIEKARDADPDLTPSQAKRKVFDKNPALYAKIRAAEEKAKASQQ